MPKICGSRCGRYVPASSGTGPGHILPVSYVIRLNSSGSQHHRAAGLSTSPATTPKPTAYADWSSVPSRTSGHTSTKLWRTRCGNRRMDLHDVLHEQCFNDVVQNIPSRARQYASPRPPSYHSRTYARPRPPKHTGGGYTMSAGTADSTEQPPLLHPASQSDATSDRRRRFGT